MHICNNTREFYTWTSPDDQHQNQIDYILCGQRWRGCKQAAKEDLGLTVAQITSFSAKFRLKLRKWGRPLGQPGTT